MMPHWLCVTTRWLAAAAGVVSMFAMWAENPTAEPKPGDLFWLFGAMLCAFIFLFFGFRLENSR